MIEIENLRVERDGQCICAIEQLTVAPHERLAVYGVNGSGKTTLLRVLAGLTRDFTGSCQVAVAPSQRTYLHQQPFLFRGTVLANVRYGHPSGAGQGPGESNSTARAWLERLAIGHLSERRAADLSGGERRRVALARALATQPRLLLLDEPLADLDDDAGAVVCETLTQLTDTTILIASPIALPEGLVDRQFRMA